MIIPTDGNMYSCYVVMLNILMNPINSLNILPLEVIYNDFHEHSFQELKLFLSSVFANSLRNVFGNTKEIPIRHQTSFRKQNCLNSDKDKNACATNLNYFVYI